MDGPVVEEIEVNDTYRRQGYGLELIRFTSRLLGRPLIAMGLTEAGKALVAKAESLGLIAESPEDEDGEFFGG